MTKKEMKAAGERILRIKEVCSKCGLTPSVVYYLMGERRFPRQIPLGLNSVGWLEREINAWIAERIAARDKSKPGKRKSSRKPGAAHAAQAA